MRPQRLPLLVFVLSFTVIAINSPARADWCTNGSNAAYFDMGLEYPPGPIWFPGPCDIQVTGATALICVRAISIPFQKARLTIPDVPGATVLGESWGVSFSGSHASGVELDMGWCVGPADRLAPVTLGYMYVVWDSPANCTTWNVVSGEIQDCDGLWRPVYEIDHKIAAVACGQCPWQLCYGPLAAYDPEPANGATNVPLDTVLKWKYTHEAYGPASYVRVSTNPDCSSGGLYWVRDQYQFAPDFLEPGRTYYWRPIWGDSYDGACQDGGGIASGPVYSFTVGGALPVQSTTWGHVKALYRE